MTSWLINYRCVNQPHLAIWQVAQLTGLNDTTAHVTLHDCTHGTSRLSWASAAQDSFIILKVIPLKVYCVQPPPTAWASFCKVTRPLSSRAGLPLLARELLPTLLDYGQCSHSPALTRWNRCSAVSPKKYWIMPLNTEYWIMPHIMDRAWSKQVTWYNKPALCSL